MPKVPSEHPRSEKMPNRTHIRFLDTPPTPPPCHTLEHTVATETPSSVKTSSKRPAFKAFIESPFVSSSSRSLSSPATLLIPPAIKTGNDHRAVGTDAQIDQEAEEAEEEEQVACVQKSKKKKKKKSKKNKLEKDLTPAKDFREEEPVKSTPSTTTDTDATSAKTGTATKATVDRLLDSAQEVTSDNATVVKTIATQVAISVKAVQDTPEDAFSGIQATDFKTLFADRSNLQVSSPVSAEDDDTAVVPSNPKNKKRIKPSLVQTELYQVSSRESTSSPEMATHPPKKSTKKQKRQQQGGTLGHQKSLERGFQDSVENPALKKRRKVKAHKARREMLGKVSSLQAERKQEHRLGHEGLLRIFQDAVMEEQETISATADDIKKQRRRPLDDSIPMEKQQHISDTAIIVENKLGRKEKNPYYQGFYHKRDAKKRTRIEGVLSPEPASQMEDLEEPVAIEQERMKDESFEYPRSLKCLVQTAARRQAVEQSQVQENDRLGIHLVALPRHSREVQSLVDHEGDGESTASSAIEQLDESREDGHGLSVIHNKEQGHSAPSSTEDRVQHTDEMKESMGSKESLTDMTKCPDTIGLDTLADLAIALRAEEVTLQQVREAPLDIGGADQAQSKVQADTASRGQIMEPTSLVNNWSYLRALEQDRFVKLMEDITDKIFVLEEERAWEHVRHVHEMKMLNTMQERSQHAIKVISQEVVSKKSFRRTSDEAEMEGEPMQGSYPREDTVVDKLVSIHGPYFQPSVFQDKAHRTHESSSHQASFKEGQDPTSESLSPLPIDETEGLFEARCLDMEQMRAEDELCATSRWIQGDQDQVVEVIGSTNTRQQDWVNAPSLQAPDKCEEKVQEVARAVSSSHGRLMDEAALDWAALGEVWEGIGEDDDDSLFCGSPHRDGQHS